MLNSNNFSKALVTHLLALDTVSLSILPCIIAFLLADGLTTSEQDVLGSFIVDIGDELSSLAIYAEARAALTEDAAAKEAEQEKLWQTIDQLQQLNQKMQSRIDYLENKLESLEYRLP